MKIIAVGRNYIDHAKELNNPIPQTPVIFSKPETAVLKDNKDFYYPDFSKDIHYEVEMVFRICNEGKYVPKKFAHKYIDAVGLGIDLTARDLQTSLKEKGLPWELAKAFDHSAVVSKMYPLDHFKDLKDTNFSLHKNGIPVQVGNTKDMIFDIESLIAFVTQYITVKKGDLIFTGTPVGVGAIAIGDKFEGFIEEQSMLTCQIK